MKKKLLISLVAGIIFVAGYSFSGTSNAGNENKVIQINEVEDLPTAGEISEASSATFSLENIPAYAGNPYININDNVPYFSSEDKTRVDAFEIYSDLDSLGRCGVAYANICEDLMPTEERGEIGSIKPSGWHTANYHEHIDGNYLYNRCHLIGYQLSGENANEKNLITGTRYLNVEGMLPFENEVSDYVKNTRNHVLYRITPVFEGNNLVVSGVLMEAYSVEDNGAGVMFNVYCYNVQPGIDINYANGESELTGEISPSNEQEIETSQKEDGVELDYVLNTNTRKFHKPDCQSVNDIKEKNRQYFRGLREELIDSGYSSCGRCKP